jgi:hypothetical protein
VYLLALELKPTVEQDYSVLKHSLAPTSVTSPTASSLVRIYPNPSTGKIVVEQQNTIISGSIRIYNALGTLVYMGPQSGQCQLIDLTAQPRGYYFIQHTNEAGATIQRVLLD